MATIQNLVIDRGASFSFTVTVRDPLGDPINLDTCTVTALIRRHPAAQDSFAFSTAAVGDPNAGVIQLSLTSAASDAINQGRYLYDILVEVFADSSKTGPSTKYKILEGLVTVNPTISRGS